MRMECRGRRHLCTVWSYAYLNDSIDVTYRCACGAIFRGVDGSNYKWIERNSRREEDCDE